MNSIKAGAFWPRPDVDSAVIRIDLGENGTQIDANDTDFFFQIVKAGFSQKRKQLKNNLRGLGYTKEEVEIVLQRAKVDGRRRAETLSIEDWHRISDELST